MLWAKYRPDLESVILWPATDTTDDDQDDHCDDDTRHNEADEIIGCHKELDLFLDIVGNQNLRFGRDF